MDFKKGGERPRLCLVVLECLPDEEIKFIKIKTFFCQPLQTIHIILKDRG